MKRGILTALGILATAAIGYCLYFSWATARTADLTAPGGHSTGLAWVKLEFGLSDAEFAALEKASRDYLPRCEARCMELARERKALAAIVADSDATAERIEAAYASVNAMEQRCFRMTLGHIYEVSGLMAPEKGALYRKHMITELMGYRVGHHELLGAETGPSK